MNFASDNWAGAHPAIAAALVEHASANAPAYGASDLDRRVERTFSEIFEREVAVFFVGTGTAANALSFAAMHRPGGILFAHREAHMIEDECGAPEYLSGGGRIHPVDGGEGLIAPEALDKALGKFFPEFVHAGRPVGVSITQASEAGTVYDLDSIAAIAAIARKRGVALHMDGARFANALVGLGCTPAEMTWKAGVDILSFGGTKNGCWCAEAVVAFDPARFADFAYIRKRAAQLFSKSRFVAAQFDAYFADGLWLANARHANAMAARLASAIEASPAARLGWTPRANEVFAVLPKALATRLETAGARFYPWHAPAWLGTPVGHEGLFRLVTSFATSEAEVNAFASHLG